MRMTRKFPYLTAYLAKLGEDAARDALLLVPPAGWVLAILGSPLIVLAGGLAFREWLPAVAVGVAFAFGSIFLMAGANRRRRLESDPHEQRKQAVYKTAAQLRGLESERKLHRWMDPIALHLLEAGAFHWSRIQTALTGPQWGSRELPVYWQQLRTQVSQAAQEGMSDLLLLTRNCVGPPQKDRESDIKGIFESFVDLDLADALQGLKQMAKSDWTAYAHQSPQAEAVAIHGRAIAERLKELADDVEEKASEIAIDSATSGGLQSLDALDGVLGELRTVRQAESELEQRIHQQ